MQATLIFFVPPHGLAATLADMASVLGSGRRCVIARELTKVIACMPFIHRLRTQQVCSGAATLTDTVLCQHVPGTVSYLEIG